MFTAARSSEKIRKESNDGRAVSFDSFVLLLTNLTLTQILHGLSKHRIIHQLVEIFLKVIRGVLSSFCVEINIGLKPWTLLKHQDSMDSCHLHSQCKI